MKKLVISIGLLLLVVLYTQAQTPDTLRNKNGKIILPEKGNWAIGLDVNPVLNFVGNMFSSAGTNTFGMGLVDNGLFGKYYLTDRLAVRGKFSINHSKNNYENKVQSDYKADAFVTDTYEMTRSNYTISVGIEKRYAKQTRLQVFYGAELKFHTNLNKDEFVFGNAYSDENIRPTSTVFSMFGTSHVSNLIQRTTKYKQVQYRTFVRVFAGLEYFVIPKISLGTEFGLSYGYTLFGQSVYLTEEWDGVNMRLRETWQDNAIVHGSGIYTDMLSGTLYAVFYF